jgi:hypothetical protein
MLDRVAATRPPGKNKKILAEIIEILYIKG